MCDERLRLGKNYDFTIPRHIQTGTVIRISLSSALDRESCAFACLHIYIIHSFRIRLIADFHP
jgi:hypothetical protein